MTTNVDYRQCYTADGYRKTSFMTRKQAIKVRSLNPGSKKRMRAYKCSQCGFWHLGHMRTIDP